MSDPIGPYITLQMVFILLCFFCSVAKSSAQYSSERKIKKIVSGPFGDKLAALAQHSERMVSAMQLCTLICACLSSSFAVSHFAKAFSGIFAFMGKGAVLTASVAIILLSVFVMFVLGILVPQRLGMIRAEKCLRTVYYPARLLSFIVYPFSIFLTFLSSLLLKLFKVSSNADASEVSEDEIRLMVDIGEEAGAIESAEKEMIENIFEFNNLTAEDVMIHRTDMEIIWTDDSQDEILEKIRATGLSRFPVCGEDVDDVVGILNTRDYLLNISCNQPQEVKVLLRSAYFIPESVPADVLFRDMQLQKIHLAIVVDEYGGTAGLVTMEDLLEQLVGEIYDEFDNEQEQEISKVGENLWRISGGAFLEDVSEALGIPLSEDEEYDTFGGLIFSQLAVIPDDGSNPEIDACGMHIKVEQIQERRVEWALVSLPEPESLDENEK